MHETSSVPIGTIRSRVQESRRNQGLPGCITDPAILIAAAALLKADRA
jgi:hypothetical protein